MLPIVIVFVSDQYKTQGMFNKAFLENVRMLKFVTVAKIKKCVTKRLVIIVIYYNLSSIALRLGKCVIKLLTLILIQYTLILINIRLNIKSVDTCPFVFVSFPDQYKSREM